MEHKTKFWDFRTIDKTHESLLLTVFKNLRTRENIIVVSKNKLNMGTIAEKAGTRQLILVDQFLLTNPPSTAQMNMIIRFSKTIKEFIEASKSPTHARDFILKNIKE